jgi:hypothetical protein
MWMPSAATKKPATSPACKIILSETLGPDLLQTPGGWGLRNPVLEGRPGPEATGFHLTFQLGARLSEFGQHYDVTKESVRLSGTPGRTSIVAVAMKPILPILPLAGAPVRRDHLLNYGHT